MQLWTTTAQAPVSAPVVDHDGNILVVGNSALVKYAPDGSVVDSTPIGTASKHAPALSTDGVYATSPSALLPFDQALSARPAVHLLGAGVTGAPRVGPDGILWVPTDRGMARIPGHGQIDFVGGVQRVVGSMAFTRSGAAVWTTEGGRLHLYEMDRFGQVREEAFVVGGPFFAPSVGPDGDVYLSGSRTLRRFSVTTGTPIWAVTNPYDLTTQPAIHPAGMIFVGTSVGVLAFTPTGDVRWRRELGLAVPATPTVDNNRVYATAGSRLYALDLGTGEVMWSVDLGDTVDARSTPVIGANRTIYVTTQNGRLVAVSEGWLILPSDLRVEARIGAATIHWRDNSFGETGFSIESCQATGVCLAIGSAAANSTSFQSAQLPAGLPLIFRVQAIGTSLETSNPDSGRATGSLVTAASSSSDFAYSSIVVPLAAAPAAPTNLTAQAHSAQSIEVDWTYSFGTTHLLGFDVFRSATAGGTYTLIGSVSPSALHFFDNNLQANTSYFYRVAARSDGGASAQIGPASATTKAIGLPAPTDFHATTNLTSTVLTWQDNATTETGYVVERKMPGGIFDEWVLLPANVTTFSDSFLLVDGEYEYRVKAVSVTAESRFAWTNVKHRTTPYTALLPLVLR